MKRKFNKLIHKAKEVSDRLPLSLEPTIQEDVPRITNETVAVHREEVLSSARKYIYPLQHSKHRIVVVTTTLVIVSMLAFFSFCMLSLYRFKQTNSFIYRVTQVIPFPVAKKGSTFISYENYLFELRHYVHYYQTQQKVDFRNDPKAKAQLIDYEHRALDKVINDSYIKQLATKYKITVSDQEVQHQIDVARSQSRLGNNDKVLEDVLKESWGWSIQDFQRVLRSQIMEQKVLSVLDTDTHKRADDTLAQLKAGGDFTALAGKVSDDISTRATGGEYGFLIDQTNRDVDPEVIDALYKLQPGQFSDVVNTGYSLEIVKVISKDGNKIKAAHIPFNFKDINTYLNDLKDKQRYTTYIKLPSN